MMHLGATNFKLKPNDDVFEQEKELIKFDEKIMVLGLHAPALYFSSLYRFEKVPAEK